MVNIEVMYPEILNLYGDTGNILYLNKWLKNDARIFYTGINDEPKFIKEKIDFIYFGPSTESNQELVIKKLLKYKNEIKNNIEEGTKFLVIGNSLELFGKYIEKVDGTKIKCLGIFNVYSKRVDRFRFNENTIGVTKDNISIVGFKNQMSHLYGDDNNYFINIVKGTGRNLNSKNEGIMYKNFIGTYLLGPILINNPYFTKSIFKDINKKLLYEDILIKSYKERIKEFSKEK